MSGKDLLDFPLRLYCVMSQAPAGGPLPLAREMRMNAKGLALARSH